MRVRCLAGPLEKMYLHGNYTLKRRLLSIYTYLRIIVFILQSFQNGLQVRKLTYTPTSREGTNLGVRMRSMKALPSSNVLCDGCVFSFRAVADIGAVVF